MDSLFKQKLLSLRDPKPPRTFREALMGTTYWNDAPIKVEGKERIKKENYSEKVQVIESLERFAQDKAEKEKTQLLKFDGGEIVVKEEPDWSGVEKIQSPEELKKILKLEGEFLDINLAQKLPGEVKVLFVSEKFRPLSEARSELKSGFINELIIAFPLKTAELFERMISAMKLEPKEVIIFPVEGSEGQDFSQDVLSVTACFRPTLVITLGASATSKILKSNDRLSLIHGQFFSRKLGEGQAVQIVPLFHPSIIETNQNMKKTAWADMQKIMKSLKKLP
jgi:uracil-DNA glycosylase family 4